MSLMYFTVNQITKIVHPGLKPRKKKTSLTREIGIRAIINKRQAILSTTNFDKSNIDKVLNKVYEMAKVVPKNEFCGLVNTYEVKINKKQILKLQISKKKNIHANP